MRMRKLLLITIGLALLILFLTQICFADNIERIKELQSQQQKVLQDIQQAQQFIQNKQAEALKIQGKIEMLQELDKEEQAKKIEKPQTEGVK